ncbi:MAG: hypothetical protein N2257_10470 [Thermodesulfovibrionales bacterium]|nr:hypothetical protein [Thermodesulfovibrionales bacterium]
MKSDLNISEIKELAKRFTPEEIERCITEQLESGKNICIRNGSSEKIINELVKARFIRELMEKGFSLSDALRELARRIRLLQSFSGNPDFQE